MNKKIISFLLFGLIACSEDPAQRPTQYGEPSGTVRPDPAVGENADGNNAHISIAEESPLAIRSEQGSNLRFADGHALTAMYKRIFPLRTYGFEQCRNSNFAYRSDCFETVFTPDERPFMGMIDIHSPRFGRGPQNIRRPEDMTLNYTRSLRVALGRECLNLVTTEMKNLAEGKASANLLIKGDLPTPETLNEFFRKVIGAEGTSIAVDIASEQYVAAFQEFTAVKNDNDTRQKAYFGLCISIAMDPQVFLY